jgi:nitronate monooxygenase
MVTGRSASAADAFHALTGARIPIVQAPMAGASEVELAVGAIEGGGLGSLPCALLSPEQAAAQVAEVRARTDGPINLNFFCHDLGDAPDDGAWRAVLAPFYAAERVLPTTAIPVLRRPFDAAMADMVEAVRPEVASFHFGLPETTLLARVRQSGARIFGNATTQREARWLAAQGCDAVIAQGFEAGGHAGFFLDGHYPVGTLALVRQCVAVLDVPVIAAGGIVDESGVAAAIALGAAAVQIGTAYLACPESTISPMHRARLGTPGAADSIFTNLFTGGLARGLRNRLIDRLGAVSPAAPRYPYSTAALAPLRAAAEADGRDDYSPLWAGQGAPLVRAEPAQALTERLGAAALATTRSTA